MSRKVLVVSGHPDLELSKVNKAFLHYFEGLPVTIHKLQDNHHNYSFTIENEQKLLIEHDRIVLLFPLYWYSVPALMKKWLDDVLAPGFAIGRADKLKNKEIMVVTTVGAFQEGYCAGGFNRFTIDELLRPMEQMTYRIKARYITPIKIYGATFMSPSSIEDSARSVADQILKDHKDPTLQYEQMIQRVPDLWQKKSVPS